MMARKQPISNLAHRFWILKGCKRCHGDLIVEDGTETCLQCGYSRELVPVKAFGASAQR